MQEQMQKQAEEIAEKTFTAAAGGGAVEVTVSGKKDIVKLHINPEAVDPDDIEMLEDMIMAAANEAMKQVDAENSKLLGGMTGGFGF